ncbi:sigma-70 family RNA polymerase sigma factor [bacterium]|nr:sigma-70 family RNA polymerase sigma factor [bacterium]
MSSGSSEKKFLELIREHENILHKICRIYTNNRADRQDMYQEILLQLWKSYGSFEGRSSFATWMYRVALNTAITTVKKPALLAVDRDLSREAAPVRCSGAVAKEDLDLLYEAIAQLKPVDKAVILLWLEDRTYEEIAGLIGISVKNVSVRLVRIRKKLETTIKGMV